MSGRWEPVVNQIWETNVKPCECCGQIVAKQLWIAEVEGVERRFCGQACEELYRSYVVPKQRAAAP